MKPRRGNVGFKGHDWPQPLKALIRCVEGDENQAFAEWGRGLGVAPCPREGISVGSSPTCQSAQ